VQLAALGGTSTQLRYTASARADHTAPVLTRLHHWYIFYPKLDGYRDTFPISLTLNEKAVVTLVVENSRNKVVHRATVTHAATPMTMTWNGRDRDGRVLPAGWYHWSLSWHDAAGNHRSIAARRAYLSSRVTAARTTQVTVPGNRYWQAGGSDPSCSTASTRGSFYPSGLWLSNDCSGAIAAAFYRVRVPSAVSYSRIAVQAWGFTDTPGARIFRTFGLAGAGTTLQAGSFTTLPATTHRLWSFGSVPAAGVLSAGHYALVALSVDDRPTVKKDFDISYVRLTVSYRVLV
jgi:hypothetical protein